MAKETLSILQHSKKVESKVDPIKGVRNLVIKMEKNLISLERWKQKNMKISTSFTLKNLPLNNFNSNSLHSYCKINQTQILHLISEKLLIMQNRKWLKQPLQSVLRILEMNNHLSKFLVKVLNYFYQMIGWMRKLKL